MTEQNQYIFDPVIAEDERLCGDCRHKHPGAVDTGWGHVVEVLWCWLFGQPFTSTTCRVFGPRLEVFKDGETCRFKRCSQCKNAWHYLRPVDYAELPVAEVVSELRPLPALQPRDAFDEHCDEQGKPHLKGILDSRGGNVAQIRRRR